MLVKDLRRAKSYDEIAHSVEPVLSSYLKIRRATFQAVLCELARVAPALFAEMVNREFAHYSTKRFSLETILSWVDLVSNQRQHDKVQHFVEIARGRKIPIPERHVVLWAHAALDSISYKPAGMIIINGDAVQSSMLSEEALIRAAEGAAERSYDHGISRLFGILVERWRPKKHGRLSREKVRVLGEIIALTSRREEVLPDFWPNVLLRGAASRLNGGDFERVFAQYRRLSRHYLLKKIKELKKTWRRETYLKSA